MKINSKRVAEGHYSLKLCPIKYGQSVAQTLIKEADFRIQQELNGSLAYVKTYQAKEDGESGQEKYNEMTYIDPPLLQDQEYFTEAFGESTLF